MLRPSVPGAGKEAGGGEQVPTRTLPSHTSDGPVIWHISHLTGKESRQAPGGQQGP